MPNCIHPKVKTYSPEIRKDFVVELGGVKMNEIAKCTFCGKEPLLLYIDNELIELSHCGVSCSSPAIWNKIAAAMELAKAEVAASNVVWSVPLERLDPAVEAAESMLFQARMRVLEVFK